MFSTHSYINVTLNADAIVDKMKENNVFTFGEEKRVGQIVLYLSLKLVYQIWVLNEQRMQPGNPKVSQELSLKLKGVEAALVIYQATNLHS